MRRNWHGCGHGGRPHGPHRGCRRCAGAGDHQPCQRPRPGGGLRTAADLPGGRSKAAGSLHAEGRSARLRRGAPRGGRDTPRRAHRLRRLRLADRPGGCGSGGGHRIARRPGGRPVRGGVGGGCRGRAVQRRRHRPRRGRDRPAPRARRARHPRGHGGRGQRPHRGWPLHL